MSHARWLPLLVVVAACDGGSDGAPQPGDAPTANGPAAGLVLIVADTLRADRAGPEAPVETPHLDRLAADGASFERAFTHAPITLPAHVALFSSRPCHETGVITNGQLVPADLPLLAEHLRDHGYANHAVTSLGSMRTGDPTLGLGRGFETYDRAGGAFIDPGDVINRQLAPLLDRIVDEEPFFLFAHYSDPHEPYNDHAGTETARISVDGEALATVRTSNMTTWTRRLELPAGEHTLTIEGEHELRLRTLALQCGAETLEPVFVDGRMKVPSDRLECRFEVPAAPGGEVASVQVRLWISDHPARREIRGRYAGEVRFVDEQIGVLLDELRARGLYDRSLIVFTSDHGESLGERRHIGHVRSLHDELLHVPLVIKPPAGSPRLARLRERTADLAAHVDVVPTVLEILDLPPLPGQRGLSLLGDTPRRFVLSQTYLPDSIGEAEMEIDLLSIRDTSHKLVYHVDEDRFELYDLEADPGEKSDVFDRLDESRARWPELLRSLLEASRSQLSETSLDEATMETLEALGYVGD